jgi:hypothetical protein
MPCASCVGTCCNISADYLTRHRFTSTQSFLSIAPDLRESLQSQLKFPKSFFDTINLHSNGFSTYDRWLDENGQVEFYSE